MKRTVLIAAAIFAVVVFGFLAYTGMRVDSQLPKEVTPQDDGSFGVAGFAVLDSAGVVQAPDGMYYDFAKGLDADVKAWIRSEQLYVSTFEPLITTDWEDSLGRFPVLAGTWIYYRE